MKYSTKIKFAFSASLVVSICWLIGDILLVGFGPDPDSYPLFSREYADKVNVEIAVHMIEGSTDRLMLGALIAALSAPMLLAAMWLVYQLYIDREKWYAVLTYYLLLSGAVLAPLAHAACFYVGEIHKAIYNIDKIAHPYLIDTAHGFVKMLNLTWGAAIFVLAVGWLVLIICIFAGKTILPKWAGLITLILLTAYQLPLTYILPKPFIGWVAGATFKIAYLVFFLSLLILFRKKVFGFDKDSFDSSEKIIQFEIYSRTDRS